MELPHNFKENDTKFDILETCHISRCYDVTVNRIFPTLAPTCGANQRYSSCIQGECRPLDCKDKGKNLPCPRFDKETCIKGCVCVEGYLKNENGECVPEDQCKRKLLTGHNQIY